MGVLLCRTEGARYIRGSQKVCITGSGEIVNKVADLLPHPPPSISIKALQLLVWLSDHYALEHTTMGRPAQRMA